jgi:hypothetical protein
MTFNGEGEIDIDSMRLIQAFVVVLSSDLAVVKVDSEKRMKSCSFKELGLGAATFVILGKPRSRLRVP